MSMISVLLNYVYINYIYKLYSGIISSVDVLRYS